jgi:DNA (cytosine-5)-methyltransferase 1
MAANHWQLAVDTHQANFPDTDHDVADISQVEPRRYRRTDILWASPECTNHSNAKGRKRQQQPGLWDKPDPSAERSRATMWDVPRFAEVHHYAAVIVENVVEAAQWAMFPAWLLAMKLLGYEHHIVWLNSMHAPALVTPRAPQSRDRMYVVFWRAGNRVPDLDIRPPAWCPACEREVAAVQVFKRRTKAWPLPRWGCYRAQYVYRCPTPRCHIDVEPYTVPAAHVIDWADAGLPIVDRVDAKGRPDPLKPATIARIETGLARYTGAQLVPAGGTRNTTASPVDRPFRTRTTTESEGLVLPSDCPPPDPAHRLGSALVVPYYGTGRARLAGDPLPTLGTVDTAGLAFIAELRGGGSDVRPVSQPLAAVCAGGNHHMLIRHHRSGHRPHDVQPPTRTHTPTEQVRARLEDCRFRMLQVAEIQAAMAFPRHYVVLGTARKHRIRQLGNGVTPPAPEWIVRAVVTSLGGDT